MAGFTNPFRPGAGHAPPYLAGREAETNEFRRLLEQDVILENMVLTGLRGVGKTVLLDSLKPIATASGWVWVGSDLSEATSVSENSLAIRLCTDLSVVTSAIVIGEEVTRTVGFGRESTSVERRMTFDFLTQVYERTPGLSSDKLKAVIRVAWMAISKSISGVRGIVFAYDEAQNLADQDARDQYPLSLLLDVFQSIQKQDLPLMLVLTGLPTLFPKLVDARTFSERMFRVVFLKSLDDRESRDAILRPIEGASCPVKLSDQSVKTITRMSGGYPYFIQFICREVYDVFIHQIDKGEHAAVPVNEIERKLDTDFFAGRWARASDRQRELLQVVATLDHCDEEFTVQEIVDRSQALLTKPFGNSHANQILVKLTEQGLVFKNRHGKYSFAVPLLGRFIQRQSSGP